MPTTRGDTAALAARLTELQRQAETRRAEAEQAKGRLAAIDEELAERWDCKTVVAAEKLLATKRREATVAQEAAARALADLETAVRALEGAASTSVGSDNA